MLGSLSVPHPVVMAQAVKGDLDKRTAADLLHLVKDLLRDVITVRVKLLDKHPSLVDLPHDVHETLMHHGLAAGYGQRVDAAVLRLVKQVAELLKAPLRHQGGIVGGIEAVQTVIVAFAGDHQIHFREILIIVFPVRRPVRRMLALFTGGNKISAGQYHDRFVRF